MIADHRFLQNLTIFGSIVPLAIFLGYLLVVPTDMTTYGTFGLLFLVLTFPLILRWHHPLLVAAWNVGFIIPIRGSPYLWLIVAFVSLGVVFTRRTLGRGFRLQNVPSVTVPLLFLAALIIVTGIMRGGAGFGSFGGRVGGGKRYLLLLGAIVGYFALSSQRISDKRARLAVLVYLLSGLTFFVGYLLPYVPRPFYFIFEFFPFETSGLDIVGGQIVRTEQEIARNFDLATGFTCIANAIMALCGLRRLLTFRRPWITLLFVITAAFSLVGGFRSNLVMLMLTVGILFVTEGLLKTRLFPITLVMATLVACLTIPYVTKLPLSMQRALSVLPIEVSPVAKMDADVSTEWRLRIWRIVWPEVPKYLWLGKGFAIDVRELQLVEGLVQMRQADTSEVSQLAGDYHNGPLSLIIPLGVFGVAGFLWFLAAGGRVLWLNYRRAPKGLKEVNGFLFAAFVAQTIFFFGVYGSFFGNLMIFTGLVGLSASINGGLRQAAGAPQALPVPVQPSSRGLLIPAPTGRV
jgi:hypothetical protein